MELFIDLGTSMGWCADDDGVLTSGTVSFKNDRFEGGGMRFLRFKEWLSKFERTAGTPTAVYFEEVRAHVGTTAAHVYGGFLAILTSWCEARSIPYRGVQVGDIKEAVTGKRVGKKDKVIAAVEALGFSPKNDDEADAIALAQWRRQSQERDETGYILLDARLNKFTRRA